MIKYFPAHFMRSALSWHQNQEKALQEKYNSIPLKHGCKTCQENASESNQEINRKDNTSWLSGVYPRNASPVKH